MLVVVGKYYDDYCKADSDDDIGSIVGSSNSDMS